MSGQKPVKKTVDREALREWLQRNLGIIEQGADVECVECGDACACQVLGVLLQDILAGRL